jgi:hypothetical protein
VRLALAGLSFEIEADGLSAGEAAFCSEHAASPVERPDFALSVAAGWPAGVDPAQFPDRAPARVEALGAGRLRVSHRRFLAELDLPARRGVLHREAGSGGLPISLRVALCALLPASGGLPLHAAGVVLASRGLAFFGVSGAGKSTLAAAAPGSVLSDELVVLRSDPWRLLPSGFWGEVELLASHAAAPLVALFDLSKTSGFQLERLSPRLALQRLLATVLVPPDTGSWTQALLLAARVTREVPVYRLGYALGTPPWDELAARLHGARPLEASA